MALSAIACPKCQHRGYASALPALLCCCVCGHRGFFRSADYRIRGALDYKPPEKLRRKRKGKCSTRSKVVKLGAADVTATLFAPRMYGGSASAERGEEAA